MTHRKNSREYPRKNSSSGARRFQLFKENTGNPLSVLHCSMGGFGGIYHGTGKKKPRGKQRGEVYFSFSSPVKSHWTETLKMSARASSSKSVT